MSICQKYCVRRDQRSMNRAYDCSNLVVMSLMKAITTCFLLFYYYDNNDVSLVRKYTRNLTRSLTTSGIVSRSSDVTSCLSGRMTTFTSSSYCSCSTSKPPSMPGQTRNKRGGKQGSLSKEDAFILLSVFIFFQALTYSQPGGLFLGWVS